MQTKPLAFNPKSYRDKTISVVVPFFNEAANLPDLLEALCRSLDLFSPKSEIILIDDGSTDAGGHLVGGKALSDSRIKLITFRRNFGQTAGWSAGIQFACGEVLVFLDADLQNDPADIPLVAGKIFDEGYDVVSGWRRERKDTFLTRRLPSVLANRLISWVTGVHLHDYGCSLKAYRADLLKNIRLYGEMHRFLPAYAAFEGAQILEIPVQHHPRRQGKSKYGLSRVYKVILDLITVIFMSGFATKPLYAFGSLGGYSLLGGTISFSVVAYRVLILKNPEATPMIFLTVVFVLAGLQFIMMGLLAELAIRIYHEAQAKPTYRIKSLCNLEPLSR